jgi:hypothetical protein
MTHKLDTDDFFIHKVQEYAVEARLNFFLVEPLWVDCFYEALEKGRVWSRVLLNMHSEHHQPDEVFHRLVRLAAERNVQVIDHPDRALQAFDKARLHPRLAAAGVSVPFTVLVSREEALTFKLTDDQRAQLGSPFVVKPRWVTVAKASFSTQPMKERSNAPSRVSPMALLAAEENRASPTQWDARLLQGVLCVRFYLVSVVELFYRSVSDCHPPGGDRL